MKHFILTLVFAAMFAGIGSFGASAQVISSAEDPAQESTAPSVRRSGRVLSVDGKKLTAEETYNYVSEHCGLPYAQSWRTGAKLYKNGTGLLISSAVLIPVGTVSLIFGQAMTVGGALGSIGNSDAGPNSNSLLTAGIITLYGGVALLTAGFTCLVGGAVCVPIGKNKMNNIANCCNAASSGSNLTMNIGSCPHGVGVTLNF